MRRLHRLIWSGAVATVLIPAAGTRPAAAQFPPQSLENVQVLDANMNPRQIIGVMRTFSIGLGVRCEYCHVGEAGANLSTFDFVSDEKATKQKAREMLRMVMAINNEHLAGLPERSDPPLTVGCVTCHRGIAKPVTIQSVLIAVAESDGVDAAIGRYDELREQYYGSHSYDFSEGVLVEVSQAVNRSAGVEEAVKFLHHNVELFPTSVQTHVGLGQAYNLMEDKETAIRHLERALELAPGTGFIERLLEQVRGA